MDTVKRLLARLDALSNKAVARVFAFTGFVTYIVCINNPFQGDDIMQIVDNLPVHFFQNVWFFFTTSTFYNGQDMVGTYYRPLMTTTFSFIYNFFQTWTGAYHLFSIALFTAGAFVLYLVLKRFIKQQWLALTLALLFLVHPMNSQIVFSIACMQDALMFFFGITALYILMTRSSWRSLILVAGCLLLTLFSKESGLAYVAVAFAHLVIFNRKRIWRLATVMVGPIAIYLYLKTISVGLLVGNAYGAPIDYMSLGVRLLTAPSIMAFYFAKFIFPLQLSTCWYWTEQSYSVMGVLVPALIDIMIIGIFIWLGILVKRKRKKTDFYAYIFFAFWAVLGIVPYLQIAPLDMTACETWFCFSMIGVLAMIGLALPIIKIKRRHIKPEWILLTLLIFIVAFAIRTIERGTNYSSQYSIAVHDLAVSKDDYSAMNNIAQYMNNNKRYDEAREYALQSIDIFPGLGNYDNLGVSYQQTGKYDLAVKSYNKALTYGSADYVYENLAQIYLANWSDPTTEKFLEKALKLYPNNNRLLSYMAILKGAQGDNASAKKYITKAAKYDSVVQVLYDAIINNKTLTIPLPTSTVPIVIK